MTAQVTLRDVTEADLPIFYEHQLDPQAARMASFPSRGEAAFMEHWAKVLVDETIVKQTILLDGQVVGNIVSFVQVGQREIGYWIGREHWGKGIATQALRAFLAQTTERPLYAHVARQNPASLRVLEKCGFVLCGEEADEYTLILDAEEAAGAD